MIVNLSMTHFRILENSRKKRVHFFIFFAFQTAQHLLAHYNLRETSAYCIYVQRSENHKAAA